MADQQEQYKRLRGYLNPAFKGPGVDAILNALASSSARYVNNLEAVHDQVYIASAEGRYLDQRLADFGLDRPTEVGLSDDVYRDIGISVVNRKQVRDLILKILGTIFGEDLTQASANSSAFEPYNLDDGDTLIVQFDGSDKISITFDNTQFVNISAATAQEVADAITRSIRAQGKTGRAFARDDGSGAFVVLTSDTQGPASSVAVFGGRAQNELLFPESRPTTAGASTQWTVTQEAGGNVRYTWSGGANPSIGRIRIGDYVNIYSSAFDEDNRGTFSIIDFQGGSVNDAYFEVENPNGVSEIVVQGTVDGVLFFKPSRLTLNSKTRYATLFQEETSLLEIFIPATTKVIRRDRKGAAHIHGPANIVTETFNPGKNEITDISVPAFAFISDGQYFLINSANDDTEYYVYFDTTGGNLVDPAIVGKTGIRVNLLGTASAIDVAVATANILNGIADFIVSKPTTATLRVNNSIVGITTNAANGNVPGLTVSVFQQGVDLSDTSSSAPNPDEGLPDTEGPYIYDPTSNFVVSDIGALLTTEVGPDSSKVIVVDDASDFPDESGNLILGYGTSHQEGPIPYLARPSANSILISPAYNIQQEHPVGTDVALVAQLGPVQLSKDGSDFPFYLTNVVAGRIYAEELIKEVVATGINVVITVLYPGDEGIGKWSTENSEKVYVWGDDPV